MINFLPFISVEYSYCTILIFLSYLYMNCCISSEHHSGVIKGSFKKTAINGGAELERNENPNKEESHSMSSMNAC